MIQTRSLRKRELMAEFQDYAYVQLEKAEGDAKAYIGRAMFFPVEQLEKI